MAEPAEAAKLAEPAEVAEGNEISKLESNLLPWSARKAKVRPVVEKCVRIVMQVENKRYFYWKIKWTALW